MRVLIVTGASGGHIFPALALVEALKANCNRILLVLPEKSKENKIPVSLVKIEYIHTVNLGFNLNKKNIFGVYFFILAAWESLRILIKFKPNVVVGFGSLNTAALIFWAWLFRINTIIHEQNVIPGRANRLLAKLANKVAVSFSQTTGYLNISAKKIALVGNPLRKELIKLKKEEALDFFGLKERKFNILITGGSQGAHKLNTLVFKAISEFKRKEDLQVIHITGVQDFNLLKNQYISLGISYKVFDFFPAMQYAYSLADLVICRAGAITIAELQRFCLPAILIPYPFAYAHQLANARVLENTGAALIINDQELSVERLSGELQKFLENPAQLETMCQAYNKIQAPDAAALFAEEVLNLCG